jgi:hypothetical protein
MGAGELAFGGSRATVCLFCDEGGYSFKRFQRNVVALRQQQVTTVPPRPPPCLHTLSCAQPVEGAGASAGAGGGTIDDSPPPEDDSLFSKFESSDSEGEEESKSG